jgi:hypothetical protein
MVAMIAPEANNGKGLREPVWRIPAITDLLGGS